MTLLRRRRAQGEARAGRRPPRLILRFALFTALGLGIAGASILFIVRGFVVRQKEDAAKQHARFVAEAVLSERLRPSDLSRPAAGDSLERLDRLFEDQILADGVLHAALYSRSGLVTYSTDHGLIGARDRDSSAAAAAAQGRLVRSSVGSEAVRGQRTKVLKELVPIRFAGSGRAGALVLWNDYAPIASAARSASLPVAVILELLLVGLFLALLPALRRVTREMRSHVAKIERQALHDDLTGLPNRVLFADRVERALVQRAREGGEVGVLLIDLDHFKEVNDTLGHPAGDALLQDLAKRLTSILRECDTVARLGGDEFGIVLTSIALDDVRATAGRVHAVLDAPFAVHGVAVSVGASVGVALAPAHGSDAATLVKHADVAMYAAKRHGSGYEIYDTATDHTNRRRLALAGELRKALDAGEIIFHYQPNVDLVSGRVVSLEALARWQHPERGLLPASEFIFAAEQVGLTRILSRLALCSALKDCAGWQQASAPLAVAVNLDMRSLLDLELPAAIAKLLDELRLDPSCLDIEITESSIMADPVRVRRVALELASIGVPLVIDDFGTGYSSLSYLKQLPISKLKIDRSFVSRMAQSQSDEAIVRATVDLAHNLGLKVVAEGVEDVVVVEMLCALGCDLAQGYFFGEPVPADGIRLPALASVP